MTKKVQFTTVDIMKIFGISKNAVFRWEKNILGQAKRKPGETRYWTIENIQKAAASLKTPAKLRKANKAIRNLVAEKHGEMNDMLEVLEIISKQGAKHTKK